MSVSALVRAAQGNEEIAETQALCLGKGKTLHEGKKDCVGRRGTGGRTIALKKVPGSVLGSEGAAARRKKGFTGWPKFNAGVKGLSQ